MKKIWKENRIIIIFLLMFFMLITYCGLQTFIINDDLPYSLFNRSNVRVTNIIQILRNQGSDYLYINGRFFIHCVVQFVLMWGKNLFSVLNALSIIISLIFMARIITMKNDNITIRKPFVYFLLTGLFLLLGSYKYLIYWVAGAVNYVWLFSLLLIFIYYYLRVGLDKYRKINCLLVFVFSIVHECSFVFILFLLIGEIIRNIIYKAKALKEYLVYFVYIMCSIVGGLIVIKAPGNAIRMASFPEWYNLNLFEKLNISIPVVSKNLFDLFNIDNLIPTIFLTLLIVYGYTRKNKSINILNIMLIIVSVLSFILNNGWLYFVLSILVFIIVLLLGFIEKDLKMIAIMLGMYSVVFSMIITPEYLRARPNYYIYLWMIICTFIYLNRICVNKFFIKIIELVSIIFVVIMCFNEYEIYYNIGQVHKERLKEIQSVKENNLEILKYKKIDDKYAKYHADANEPSSTSYWAYKYFLYYYELPNELEIELID